MAANLTSGVGYAGFYFGDGSLDSGNTAASSPDADDTLPMVIVLTLEGM